MFQFNTYCYVPVGARDFRQLLAASALLFIAVLMLGSAGQSGALMIPPASETLVSAIDLDDVIGNIEAHTATHSEAHGHVELTRLDGFLPISAVDAARRKLPQPPNLVSIIDDVPVEHTLSMLATTPLYAPQSTEQDDEKDAANMAAQTPAAKAKPVASLPGFDTSTTRFHFGGNHNWQNAANSTPRFDQLNVSKSMNLGAKHRAKPTKKSTVSTARDGKFVIVLDAGHGGSDPGSIGHNGLREKDLTLAVATRASLFLSEIENITVELTRDSDEGMTRTRRVRRIKQANADLVVSLHLNHLPQSDINLVETFYAGPENIAESQQKMAEQKNAKRFVKTNAQTVDTSFTRKSQRIAQLMQRRVFDEVQSGNSGTLNIGVKKDTLYVLTRSFTPGALIELTCLSNHEEAERLSDPAYVDRLAAALADGIREYLAEIEVVKLAKVGA